MKYVTYVRTGNAVIVKPVGVILVLGGQPYKPAAGEWSMAADALEQLRAENHDVEFTDHTVESPTTDA